MQLNIKNVKIKQRAKKQPKQNMKSNYAPAILRKDTIGKTPKFTFSTYKLSHTKKEELHLPLYCRWMWESLQFS